MGWSETGKPLDPKSSRKHFALDIGTDPVEANFLVGSLIYATIRGLPPPPGTVAITNARVRCRFAIFWAKTRMGWRETSVDEHRGKLSEVLSAVSLRPSPKNCGAARRCRRDLRLSSAQPTGCSPPSSATPCRSAAPARARPSSGFVGSWRTAGKLLAPANGFLRFRWSIDLTRGIHRKEPGSFRATSPPVTRPRARVTGGRGHQLGEHVDRHARAAKHRIPAHA